MADQRLDSLVVALTAGLTACVVSVFFTCLVWYGVVHRALRRQEALMQSQIALMRHVRGAMDSGALDNREEAWPRRHGWWWQHEDEGSGGQLGSGRSGSTLLQLPLISRGYGACSDDTRSSRSAATSPSSLRRPPSSPSTPRAQMGGRRQREAQRAVTLAAGRVGDGLAAPAIVMRRPSAAAATSIAATDTLAPVASGRPRAKCDVCPTSDEDRAALSTTSHSRYKILRLIGYGSFASVYLVESRLTRQRYALKYMICHDDRRRMAAIRECETISSVQGHPNIIKIVDMFMSCAFGPYGQPTLAHSLHDASDKTSVETPQHFRTRSVQWTGVALTPANVFLPVSSAGGPSETTVTSHASFLSEIDTERLLQEARRLCHWRRDAQCGPPSVTPPIVTSDPPQACPPPPPAKQTVTLRSSSLSTASSQEEPLQPVWDVVHGTPPPWGALSHATSRSTCSTRVSERAAATPCSHQSVPVTTKPSSSTTTTTAVTAQMPARASYAPGGAVIRYTDFDTTPPQYAPRRWQAETHYRNFAREAAPPHATRQSSTSVSSRAGTETQHSLASATAAVLPHSASAAASRTDDTVAAPSHQGRRQSSEMQSGSTATEGSEAWRDAGYLCLVLEYHPMGDLGQYVRCQQGRQPWHSAEAPDATPGPEADDPTALNALTEAQLLSIAYQLSSVLCFLHTRCPPIVHRDLKPENILIKGDAAQLCAVDGQTDGRRWLAPPSDEESGRGTCGLRITRHFVPIVVTDFGLAVTQARTVAQQRRQGRGAGTWPYVAPECWSGRTTTASDMWSLGCVLYALATGRLTASTVRLMSSEAKQPTFARGVLDDLLERHYSLMYGTFVLSLLAVDPDRRLSAAAAQSCFRVVGDNRVVFDSQSAFFSNVLDL